MQIGAPGNRADASVASVAVWQTRVAVITWGNLLEPGLSKDIVNMKCKEKWLGVREIPSDTVPRHRWGPVDDGWDRSSRKSAAEKFDLDYKHMNEKHHLTNDTCELGKVTSDEYLNRIVFYKERNFSRNEFKNFMYAQSGPYPEVIGYVKMLKQRHGLGVGVISNEGRKLREFRIAKFKLHELVDFFVCSCFVHIRKPDRKIFQMALDLAQAEPEESLYIDDRQMFLEVARSLGIRTIHHISTQSTINALTSLGFDTRNHAENFELIKDMDSPT